MLRKTVLSFFALALALPLAAATRKAAQEEPESALSPALAKAVGAALESLDALEGAVGKSASRRPAVAIRKVEAVKADLKEALAGVREAKAEDEEAAAKDGAIVAVAAALRASDLVAQGLQEDDDDQVQAGLKLAALARGDLEALDAAGSEGALGEGGGDQGYEIGPSLGANFSFGSQTNTLNLATDLSVSLPVSQAMDLGAGFSLGLNSSDDGKTSSVSMNLGLNGFTRYHFLQAFPKSPWIVPYVGLKLGWQGNDSSSYTSGSLSGSTSSGSGTTLGLQLGSLLFVNKKTAVTIQAESSSSSNSSSSGSSSPSSSSSSSSLSISMGVRMMY